MIVDRLLILLPIIFSLYFLIQIFTFIFNGRLTNSLLSFLLAILSFYTDVKIYYTYYNLVIHIVLICITIFYWFRVRKTISIFIKSIGYILVVINISLVFIPNESVYQHWNHKEIVWRNLTWNDFKGIPDKEENPDFAAQTNSGIEWKVNEAFNYPPAIVVSYMDTYKSWKKPYIGKNESKDSLLLQHEQIHFDLYELRRRAIVKVLSHHWGESTDSLNRFIRTRARDVTLISKKYDVQTSHGLNQEVQKLWTKKMNQALADN